MAKDEASDALLFQGEWELLYDFDGPKPLAGVEFKDGRGDLSQVVSHVRPASAVLASET